MLGLNGQVIMYLYDIVAIAGPRAGPNFLFKGQLRALKLVHYSKENDTLSE